MGLNPFLNDEAKEELPVLRSKKGEIVEHLHQKLEQVRFNVLADFKGLKVDEMTRLRREVKEAHGELIVVKNTLLKLAATETDSARLDDFFVGPTAVVLGYDDPVNLAKALVGFAKDNPSLKLKAALLRQSVLSERDIVELSRLPSREVLLARLLGTLQGPPTALVNVLSGVIRRFLYTMRAIEEKKAP